jgi:hypothetical protein
VSPSTVLLLMCLFCSSHKSKSPSALRLHKTGPLGPEAAVTNPFSRQINFGPDTIAPGLFPDFFGIDLQSSTELPVTMGRA